MAAAESRAHTIQQARFWRRRRTALVDGIDALAPIAPGEDTRAHGVPVTVDHARRWQCRAGTLVVQRRRSEPSKQNELVASGAIDQVQERRATQIAAQVLGEQVRALVVVARKKPRDVRGQDHVVERVERMIGGRRFLRERVGSAAGASNASSGPLKPEVRRSAKPSPDRAGIALAVNAR
jgi:hypothetical protein